MTRRKPDWLRIKLPRADDYAHIRHYLKQNQLHTICESGQCPNQGECWANKTATFMILGDICTRSCKFCATKTGKPLIPDNQEPYKLAQAVLKLNLKHCVITSVDRDDLEDAGAAHWAECVQRIKEFNPETTIEILIPDFNLMLNALDLIVKSQPDIVSHNMETVRRLTPVVRNKAIYDRSLKVLNYLSENGLTTKSGIMVGLGETEEEVYEVMDDLLNVKCKILTIGQYLQPTKAHYPVAEYVHPDIFSKYREGAMRKGFEIVESGALVRSSYHAEKHVK